MLRKNLRRPAAQYVRMSTDSQEFSIENQKAEITRYANRFGFKVVRTYCDEGKSGLTLKYRAGLKQLLTDVLNGDACFDAVLVYDVSRWGRFQDDNEAAHYEFLCRRSGVAVHYCAESFANDGSVASDLLKSMKRVMAKELSRELGVKTYAGQARLARMGFNVGSGAGYGLRRIMFSKDGKLKRNLKSGECKNLKTDRVKLAFGPQKEVECVRRMFSMALRGLGCSEIAQALNNDGIKRESGECWKWENIRSILRNPKYMGCNVWGRTSRKLHTSPVSVPRESWIRRHNAFPAIVDSDAFNRVQEKLGEYTSNLFWSDHEILQRMRQLWDRHGRLSEWLIASTPGMPTCSTIERHFGTLRSAYDLIGYKVKKSPSAIYAKRTRMYQLREGLMEEIVRLCPNVSVSRKSWRHRPMLRLSDGSHISVRVCLARSVLRSTIWDMRTSQEENALFALVARAKVGEHEFHSLYLMPPRKWPSPLCRFKGNPNWLTEGIRLRNLSRFAHTMSRLQQTVSLPQSIAPSGLTPGFLSRPDRTPTMISP